MTASPRLLYVENASQTFLSHRMKQARRMQAAGFDIHLATPEPDPRVNERLPDVTCHHFPYLRKIGMPHQELASIWALRHLFHEVSPDISHHFTPKLLVYAGIAARLAGVPAVVHSVTGMGFAFTGQSIKQLLSRSVLSLGLPTALAHPNSLTIFQNHDDHRTFVERGWVRSERTRLVLGSGVDVERFAFRPKLPSNPKVLFVSRLLLDKGIAEFHEAARRLRGRARFVVVGDVDPGNPRSATARQVKGWVEAGDIEWLSYREDIPEQLADCSVFCLPSYREGMPQAALEAMSVGRAVVTTDVVGCRDVVEPEVTGLLVPPRDSAALATALAQLLDHPEKITAMGVAGRKRAEQQFSLDRVADLTLEAYQAVLSTSSP